jgi:hypothetical protein
MLRWNSKYTVVVLVALIALSAVLGKATWDVTNFTW